MRRPDRLDEGRELYALPDTIEMVKIPAGKFTMGSPKDELGRGEDEPQRTVTISKPFYMAKFEIKQNQYIPMMRPEYKPIFRRQAPGGRTLPELHQHGAWQSDAVPGAQPMDAVQWIHAVEFCKKLNARENTAGRLPRGIRIPPAHPKPNGNTPAAPVPPVRSTMSKPRNRPRKVRAHKTSNKFGLANMHMGVPGMGARRLRTIQSQCNATDPVAFVNGKNKVVRGGHDKFNDDPRPSKQTIFQARRPPALCTFGLAWMVDARMALSEGGAASGTCNENRSAQTEHRSEISYRCVDTL